MRIRCSSWSGHKKMVRIPIPQKCNVNLTVAALGDIIVYAQGEDGKIIIAASQHHLHTRPNLEGFDVLEIHAKEFGMEISVNGTQLCEQLNQDLPPVKPQPLTLIGKMHARARETMAVHREHFENNTNRPGYELDDDEPDEFEEDQAARLIQENQQNALDNQDNDDDPEPDPGDQAETVEPGN